MNQSSHSVTSPTCWPGCHGDRPCCNARARLRLQLARYCPTCRDLKVWCCCPTGSEAAA